MCNDFRLLISSLLNPDIYPHKVTTLKMIETHISWVVLTGTYAYKIKKPLNLGFLDFSTLAKRKYYCAEEIRLNSRLAPDIYLDVISLCGSPANPVINGNGPAIEYAVRMKQFSSNCELDKLLSVNKLKPEYLRILAKKIATFHQNIAISVDSSPHGTPDSVLAPCIENLNQIQSLVSDKLTNNRLNRIREWTSQSWLTLKPLFFNRKTEGYIRECHGDLHLHNLALIDDDVLIFDCIEFNPDLYWIDVISEVSFTVMDLDARKQCTLAWVFLNRYLQLTGDYEGIRLLRYYLVYRAMVRAKVDCIRAHQENIAHSERDQILKEFQSYLSLAEEYLHPGHPALIMMHGLSGSGKTTIAGEVANQLGAVHVRSDIERKRLSGMTETQRSGSSAGAGIYTIEISDRTYDRLAYIAAMTLKAGYPVIIDAAFLSRARRQQFYELAKQLDTHYHLIDCHVSQALLATRVASRYKAATDASEADVRVLEHQLKTANPLDEQEMSNAIRIDTSLPVDLGKVLTSLNT